MLPFLAEHSHPHGDHHWVGGSHGQYDYLSWHLIWRRLLSSVCEVIYEPYASSPQGAVSNYIY